MDSDKTLRKNTLLKALGVIALAFLLLVSVAGASPYAYITNFGDNTVSVIDTSTNAITTTVNVGTSPWGAAVNPAGTKAYITNWGSNSVSVIDTATNTVTATFTVGTNPTGVVVSPDGTKVYVANEYGNSISVINTATNIVTATVNVGTRPYGLVVAANGKKLYVAHFDSNNIDVIDTTTNTVTGTVPVGSGCLGLAATPDGKKVYVTNNNLDSGNTVCVIDTATDTITARVTVGNDPACIAITPDGKYAYVTNFFDNTVSIIDTATNTVKATLKVGSSDGAKANGINVSSGTSTGKPGSPVPVGTYPEGISITPDGKKVFVANRGANTVSVIDTATNTVTATVNVGYNPVAFGQFIVPPSGGKPSTGPFAYITNSGDNTVSVIDTPTNTVTTTVTVGNYPWGAAVNPAGTKAYITNWGDNSVSVIDTATNTVTATFTVGTNPTGVVVSPDGTKVYVANEYGNSISVINTATNIVTATVNVGTRPYGLVVAANGKKLYVAHFDSNNIDVIDTTTNTVTGTVPVGSGCLGLAVTPDGKKVYVANNNLDGGNTVCVIDTATDTITARVTVGNDPACIAITPDGKYAYVTNFFDNTVSIIDTATNTVKATLKIGSSNGIHVSSGTSTDKPGSPVPVGSNPEGISITPDGKKVFVANRYANTVSVIDTATNTVTATVNVGNNPVAFGQFIVQKAQTQNTVIKFNPETVNVRVNSAQNVKVLLSKVPDTGLAGFNITVSVADPTIATITGVSGPDWAGVSDNSSVPASSVWIHAVDLTGKVHAGDTNVSFGSINVTGLKQGKTNLNIIPTEVTDLNGSPINTGVGTCTVAVITIPPFPGCKNPPQDLDNDGLYEDINGNGKLESADVVVFFKNTQWVIDNGLVQYFDFNHDGRINSADVLKLFKMIH